MLDGVNSTPKLLLTFCVVIVAKAAIVYFIFRLDFRADFLDILIVDGLLKDLVHALGI